MDPIRACKGGIIKRKSKKGARLVACEAKRLIRSPPRTNIILLFLFLFFRTVFNQPARILSPLFFFPLLPRVCFPSLELRSLFSDARLAEVDSACGRDGIGNQPQGFHQIRSQAEISL